MCLERRFSLVWRRAPWWKILLRMFPETKKRLCPHTWDKSVNFCDTTQIDICENVHSLTRTIIRAPMDNGWGPVSPYWNNRSRLPSEVHSLTVRRSVSTIRNSLWRYIGQILLFLIGLSVFFVTCIINTPKRICQPSKSKRCRKMKKGRFFHCLRKIWRWRCGRWLCGRNSKLKKFLKKFRKVEKNSWHLKDSLV